MRPSRLCVARLFLLRGRYLNSRQFAIQRCANDDHHHIRRCHQQQQHRFVQGNFQRKAQESKRLRYQGHLLCVPQIHQLLSCARDPPQGTRNRCSLNHVSHIRI